MDQLPHEPGPSEQPETGSPDDANAEIARRKIGRRALLNASAGSLAGFFLSKVGRKRTANAQTPKGDKTYLPLVANASSLCLQTLSLLPTASAVDFYQKRLLTDPTFQMFHDHYARQNVQFIPERVHLFMGIHTNDRPTAADLPTFPFLLAIVPSFRKFDATAPNHEAASIVVLRERSVNTVLACSVIVGHNPFQIESFTITEWTPGAGLQSHSLERSVLQGLSASGAAERIGPPVVDPTQWNGEVGGLSETEMDSVVALVFETLLNDRYASPLYPPGGIQSLLRDTGLIQKWAQTMELRYVNALASAAWCTSTSTSSNACTSTSSSCFELNLAA